jgi:AraC-like DNA-binding protein
MESVVFDDHRFCAGQLLDVAVMPEPHLHSQIEFNLPLEGHFVYRFDNRRIAVAPGSLVAFWGARPHQVIEKAAVTRFVCLYMPIAVFLALPVGGAFRAALCGGAFVAARRVYPSDPEIFLRWRDDLLSGDARREHIVRDELGGRLRRLDLDGWDDLRAHAAAPAVTHLHSRRLEKVEAMARYIADHAEEPLTVDRIARAVGLNPSYAMTQFRNALGLTINEYLTRHRLDTAQALLMTSDRDVAAIAFEAGFGSLSRFYESFHGRFGMSPGHFRRRYLEATG